MGKSRILISGIGSGGTNCLLDTLSDKADYYFVGINSNKHRVACSPLKEAYLVPPAHNEVEYVEALNKIIVKHKINLFIPNSDIEVEITAKHRQDINCETFLPSYRCIRLSQDKMEMHDFCIKHNIPVANAVAFNSIEDIKKIDTKFPSYPLWCRIKSGAGSKFTSKIYSAKHAQEFIEHIMITNDVELEQFIISELLPGNDYLIMTTWNKGELIQCKMAHRLSYFGKQGQSAPYLIKSFFDEELLEFAIRTAKKFQKSPNGNFNFDIKLDSNNKITLTEINPGRFYYNMSLFNSTSNFNSFRTFLETAFGTIDKSKLPLIGKEEKYFVRDQDLTPFVLTEQELNTFQSASEI